MITAVLPERGPNECSFGLWSIQRVSGAVLQYNSIFLGDTSGPGSSSGYFLLYEGPARSFLQIIYGASVNQDLWASVRFDARGEQRTFTFEGGSAKNVTGSNTSHQLDIKAYSFTPPLAQNI